MDEILRLNERRIDAEKGDVGALVAFLRKRQRRGEKAAALAGKLSEYGQSIRKAAFRLLAMNEDEQAIQEALVLFSQQINRTLQVAIQPREGDASLPTAEQILRSVAQKITPKNAKAMLSENPEERLMNQPKLVLVPVTSPDRLEAEINQSRQRMAGSNDVFEYSDFVRNQLMKQANEAGVEGDAIKSWEFAIIDGAQTFPRPSWDNGENSLEERYDTAQKKFQEADLEIAPAKAWMATQKTALKAGKPLDCRYEDDSTASDAQTKEWQYTLFRERQNGLVGAGEWEELIRAVGLIGADLGYPDDRARLRPAVMGDIVI